MKSVLAILLSAAFVFLFASTALAAPTVGIGFYADWHSFGAQLNVPIGDQSELVGRLGWGEAHCIADYLQTDILDLSNVNVFAELGYRHYVWDNPERGLFAGFYASSLYNSQIPGAEFVFTGTIGVGGKMYHRYPHFLRSFELGVGYGTYTGLIFRFTGVAGYIF